MGTVGPPPKRSNQRRRTNKPDAGEITHAQGAEVVDVPPADQSWHPVAVRWYESLERSGQARFYEPSDYATAYLIAESISRELNPQDVVLKSGEVLPITSPPKGASLAAWLKGMSSLMVTEGDRRRLRLELERPQPQGVEEEGDVSELDHFRRRLRESG